MDCVKSKNLSPLIGPTFMPDNVIERSYYGILGQLSSQLSYRSH